jgi:hypothetical protein
MGSDRCGRPAHGPAGAGELLDQDCRELWVLAEDAGHQIGDSFLQLPHLAWGE